MLYNLSCYEQVVEQPLLQITTKYYSQYAQTLLHELSISEYLKKIDEKMEQEDLRVQYYLVPPTRIKILNIIIREMITKHMETIIESTTGFLHMLLDDKYKDLQLIHKLFSHEHLSELVSRFKKHVIAQGSKYVMDESKLKNPVSFIQGLLDMRHKYQTIITRSFDKSFNRALSEAFDDFASGVNQTRIPEYISLYLDAFMRKQVEENHLDAIMTLFDHIKDRDVFENYYRMHLGKRLLMSRSTQLEDSDLERAFVTRLKFVYGAGMTNKIEGMFNDIRLSREGMQQYREHKAYKNEDKIDFYAHVLTSGYWSLWSQASAGAVLPEQMQKCVTAFNEYYDDVHSGRKVTWYKGAGDGLIQANYPSKRYELLVSTYQMIILMAFNDAVEMSFEEIKQRTQIPDKELVKQIIPLCKTKVLSKKENEFRWNAEFHHTNVRIRVGVYNVKETTEQVKETEAKIEMDRKPIIEAAIVRIMKSRKTMHHNQLIEEVVKQLTSRFMPAPVEIKKRIESLIEREFLERDAQERKKYSYVA
jgi:hypothetical protein